MIYTLKGRIGWKGLSKDEYLERSNFRIINGTALEKVNLLIGVNVDLSPKNDMKNHLKLNWKKAIYLFQKTELLARLALLRI